MLNVRLAGDHLYGKLLFTWLSLVMSMMVSFCAVLFPSRCLRWDLELNGVSFWGFSFLLFHNVCRQKRLWPVCTDWLETFLFAYFISTFYESCSLYCMVYFQLVDDFMEIDRSTAHFWKELQGTGGIHLQMKPETTRNPFRLEKLKNCSLLPKQMLIA